MLNLNAKSGDFCFSRFGDIVAGVGIRNGSWPWPRPL